MKHLSLAVLFFFCALVGIEAQSSSSSSTPAATYKIRLGAFAQPIDLNKFNNVRDLGVVMTEPAENGFVRVSIGNYLDKATAQKVAAKAKSRGYASCFLVRNGDAFEDAQGRAKTNTMQFSAVKSLDLRPAINKLSADAVGQTMMGDMYIRYSNGYYRFSLGLFSADDAASKDRYAQTLRGLGFADAYSRQFRTPPAGWVPKMNPDPLPPITNTTPDKPTITDSKDSKMNSGTTPGVTATTESKNDKMSGKGTTTTKDAKMGKGTTTTNKP